jgi:hypothetical protein
LVRVRFVILGSKEKIKEMGVFVSIDTVPCPRFLGILEILEEKIRVFRKNHRVIFTFYSA